ncbi:MAG: methyltransferase domain-containing protein [Rhodospirillales bacterium]|nr:methyltransferase domain-containing protein [Rhodospirillales bacterium]
MIDRKAYLLSRADRNSRIVEIGPSHAPIAPKARGWQTMVVDHASADMLRQKYAALNVDGSRIEEVDVVWTDGSIADAFPPEQHGSYDLLIASHVIEHLPDLIGFFTSASRLLARDARIALAVPDKRYCFDVLKPWTTTGDILNAKGSARHNSKTSWNQIIYSATADSAFAWGQHEVSEIRLISTLAHARLALQNFSDDATLPYRDNHAWQFTPSSFALAIFELGVLGEIDWHIADITPAIGCEFLVTLAPGAPSLSEGAVERMRCDYLKALVSEMAAGLAFLARASVEPAANVDLAGSN